ncbi:MAG: zinc-dependent metalloprotease [Butyricimonas faecihominis]
MNIPRGVYDRWAIEWDTVFPNSKTADNDKKLLKNLADKRLTNKTLLYMKNTSYDLRALPSDLSSDKIEASRLGIRNMERFIKNLNKLSATEDLKANNWQTYMTRDKMPWECCTRIWYKVMENLGSRMKLERDEVFASKELQQQTMEFLAENVFAEPQEWMYDEVLTKEFGIGPKGIRLGLQEIVLAIY